MGKKSLCSWNKKRIVKDMDELIALVSNPTYVCCGCARVASDKKHLCKPSEIKVVDDDKKAEKKATRKKKPTKKNNKKVTKKAKG
jgi:hypothetical protein